VVKLPPTTFNEKVRYRMATDRRMTLAAFVDKVAVRQYVSEKVGEHLLPEAYVITDAPETLVPSDLPREFVLKPSHGSGAMVVVGDHAPRQTRLPRPSVGWARLQVHPDSLDWNRLVALCRHWLRLRYEPYREWAYSQVRPRILIEELLVSDWRMPVEYKFYTFDGNVALVSVPVDRFGDPKGSLYSPRWERLDVEFVLPRGPLVPRPAKLDEMITIAERLADRIDFVRVDLYNIGERVVFGELTVYPNAGLAEFDPELDNELGALWCSG
jgi:hypothetical protein